MKKGPKTSLSPDDFSDEAFARATRAIATYAELGDRWDVSPLRPAAVADLAVDTALALEFSLKAILDTLGISRGPNDRMKELFQSVANQSTTPPTVQTLRGSVDVVVATRNEYLHGAKPTTPAREILAAIRDVLRTVLVLANAYPLLQSRWKDVTRALWTFDGQPSRFAGQAKRHFSNKTFDNVQCVGSVAVSANDGRFAIDGALQAVTELWQERWDWTGAVGPGFETAPNVLAAVGMIGPPDPEGTPTAIGSGEQTGTLSLVVRNLPILVDGFGLTDNPLAAPLYLLPDDKSAWIVGPGSLQLRSLRLSIPYRIRSQWFITPDGRQEICSEFLDYSATGLADGELACHYPGHIGEPAFRGKAEVRGTVGACRNGSRIAERDMVSLDSAANAVKGSRWKGTREMRVRFDLILQVAFDEIEVFNL